MGRNWAEATKARCSRRLRAMLFAVRLALRAWACRTRAAVLRLRAALPDPDLCTPLLFLAAALLVFTPEA